MGSDLCTGSPWVKSVLTHGQPMITHGQPLILPMGSMPTADAAVDMGSQFPCNMAFIGVCNVRMTLPSEFVHIGCFRICVGGNTCPGSRKDRSSCGTNQPCVGIWDSWTEWTDCSVTCGGGTRARERTCVIQGIAVGSSVVCTCSVYDSAHGNRHSWCK